MKVLVSDNLGEDGIRMFQDAGGIEVDVKTGLEPEAIKAIIATFRVFSILRSIDGNWALFSQYMNTTSIIAEIEADAAKSGDENPSLYPRVKADIRKNIDPRRKNAPAQSDFLPGFPGEEGIFEMTRDRWAITTGIMMK